MKAHHLIMYLSALIWLFPPIKQHKTQYFTFFLILAIFDPILYTMYLIFRLQTLKFYPLITFLIIISLSSIKNKLLWLASFVVIIILTYVYQNDTKNLYYLCIILLSVVLFLIINKLMLMIIQHKVLNVFLSLLLVYALINELKFIAIALNLYQGVTSFYLASFTQLFFGISFSFITINTKNFPVPSKLS